MRVSEFADTLFASGYRFFLPYVPLYLLAWLVDFPVSMLVGIFVLLHALTLVLFVVFLHGRRHAFRLGDAIFWTTLLLFFLLPGAYLEYRSASLTDLWPKTFAITFSGVFAAAKLAPTLCRRSCTLTRSGSGTPAVFAAFFTNFQTHSRVY